ncbi:MAG: CPBP family intramembrane metalloprotease, partial [Chloroflexi bacterium]|nr:CPBP family intramembrane metalloprotease [Chloroflexota bacterium]
CRLPTAALGPPPPDLRPPTPEVSWTGGDVVRGILFVGLMVAASFGLASLLGMVPVSRTIIGIVLLGVAALAEGSIFVAVWLFAVRRRRASWGELGLRPGNLPRDLVAAWAVLGFGIVVQVVYVAGMRAMGLERLLPPSVIPPFAREPGAAAVLFVLAVGLAPLAEELFFRGFVFPVVARRFGIMAGGIASAALFAAAHGQVGTFVPIFVLGLALAALYVFARSLWPSIAVHGAYNLLGLLVGLAQDASTRGTSL